ncbi:MAG TPA: hypothetical protein VKB28_17815 [Solirubrobacteraceae bacterium]|nr:hypothetical protein [Solirubrobacteraceae bacterium]
MDHPMKLYGLNVVEQVLDDVLVAVGLLLPAFALVAGILDGAFGASGTAGGLLLAATALAGVLLALGGSGIRQNAGASFLGYELLAVAAVGWVVCAFLTGAVGAAIAAAVLVAVFALLVALRRRALRLRFRPRFLSLRNFDTMIAVADTMIDGDGRETVHPIEVAVTVDHLLARVESPMRKDLKLVLVITEWALPLLVWRPFPFSVLGSNDRRRAVQKVINAKGPFRDVARSLKIMSCVGYYGDQRGIAQAGFVHFGLRRRSQGVDQSPLHHPDPFEGRP